MTDEFRDALREIHERCNAAATRTKGLRFRPAQQSQGRTYQCIEITVHPDELAAWRSAQRLELHPDIPTASLSALIRYSVNATIANLLNETLKKENPRGTK